MSGLVLPEEIKAVMENGLPPKVVTCSGDGTPNVTVLSRVYQVDRDHLALSFQFFNKTTRNVRENPNTCLLLWDFDTHTNWVLQLAYERSETEGPLFDQMFMEIEAIASASGMSGIFKLKAADIYRVKSFDKRVLRAEAGSD